MFPLTDQMKVTDDKGSARCMYSSDEDLPNLWHERYGHLSKTSMKLLQRKKMVRGLPQFKTKDEVCTDCSVGKQTRKPIPKSSTWRAKHVLELVHSDICGPVNPISQGGKRYLLTFIDDYSRKGWVYLLAEKSEALDWFKVFKSMVENETGKTIKGLRTDRGGEFISEAFNSFCRECGIHRQLTTRFTPQQNGVAERKNRTVMNMVVRMLAAKKIPKVLWAEAAVWTFYVLNRCPTKALNRITLQEAWSGNKPTVEHFRVWGCSSC